MEFIKSLLAGSFFWHCVRGASPPLKHSSMKRRIIRRDIYKNIKLSITPTLARSHKNIEG